ncbi:T9SS type A sorting domain-containing protein [Cryomorphaceae bacterium 1068]|nr:T9SS type A sorting domain-containing protein [Cryomorphaceae bacterium 1068]
MKQLPLFLLILSSSFVYSQNDSLMPNLSAHYLIECTTGCEIPPCETTYHDFYFINSDLSNDTVDIEASGQVFAKIYMDSSKVYLKRLGAIPSDCYLGWEDFELSGEWELLYDYGLSVGDAAYSVYGNPTVVTSIEDIVIQGESRKKFILDEGISAYIQGIGDVGHPLLPLMFMFEVQYRVCSSELFYTGPSAIDTIYYSPNCEGGFLSSVHESVEKIAVYPNPSDGTVNVQLSANVQIESLLVVDVMGRVVLRDNYFQGGEDLYELDLTSLKAGIYTIIIHKKDRAYSSRIVLN